MEYTIYDNKGYPHFKNFASDSDCLYYMKKHFINYIVSVLSSDSIVVARPDGYILAYISTSDGEQTIKKWKGMV